MTDLERPDRGEYHDQGEDQDRRAGDLKTEQLERNIEQTRERMSRNIGEIGERLRPGNLAHTAMDSVTEGVRRTGSRLAEFVRDNPLPVAAVGLGVTWLMTQRGKSEVSGDRMARYAYTGPERRAERKDRRGVGVRIGEAAGHAREVVGDAASTVAERASELGSGAKSRMHDFGVGARDRVRENPLAVAAGAAILGLVIGFLLPETRSENRLMGGTRDRLADRAGKTVVKVADATAEVADDVGETLKSEIAERATDVKGIVQDIAHRVTDQAKESAARVKDRSGEA